MDTPGAEVGVATEVDGHIGRATLTRQLTRAGAPLVPAAVRSLVARGVAAIEVDAVEVDAVDVDGVWGLVTAWGEAVDAGITLWVVARAGVAQDIVRLAGPAPRPTVMVDDPGEPPVPGPVAFVPGARRRRG